MTESSKPAKICRFSRKGFSNQCAQTAALLDKEPAAIKPEAFPRAAWCFPETGKTPQKAHKNAVGVFVGFFAEGGGARGNYRLYRGWFHVGRDGFDSRQPTLSNESHTYQKFLILRF